MDDDDKPKPALDDDPEVSFLKVNANKEYITGVLADCIRNCMRHCLDRFGGRLQGGGGPYKVCQARTTCHRGCAAEAAF